ncbi:MAG: ubiquinol-cytochrome c reductase iron-sulfur subunit [Acidimicrobiia bacterium]
MSFANFVLIAVALFAILGAVGAFTIAFRRARKEEVPDATAGVSAETLAADRSLEGVEVVAAEEPVVEVTEAGEVVEEAEEPASVPAAAAAHIIKEQRVVEVSAEEAGVTRRQFFNRALTATFGSFLAFLALDSLAFFWPRLTGGFGADIDAGEISEVAKQVFTPDGAVIPLFIPEARAYIVPAPPQPSPQFEGKPVELAGLIALWQRCVHLGCRVPWCHTSQGFECPCHGSKYSYIGEYFAGPAPRNLDRFVVEERNGRFIIKTGTIIQTPRAPVLYAEYPQGPSCIGA